MFSTGELHCNITKISSFSKVSNAIEELIDILPSVKVKQSSIDNITATTSCDRKQNLNILFVKLYQNYQIKYNAQKFPAFFIKYPTEEHCVTVFIFSSGKVICVGGKSVEGLKQTSHWLKTVINTL